MTTRLLGLLLLAAVLMGVGGCVYDPAYYHHGGVVYDDEVGTYAEPYYDSYYAGPYYYDPWYYGYGFPYVGLGFSYYGGGHHHYHHHSSTHTYHHHH